MTGAALAAAGIRRTKMFQGTIDTGAAMAVEATANGDVLFDLGVLYSSGRNGLIDLIAAHKWFNLAALKGRVDAISLRQEIAGQMSSAEIAAAQREARAWMTTH
jgi:TPR repeat protein